MPGARGTIASSGLFFVGENIMRMGHTQLPTPMDLKLAFAGRMTFLLARTRGPFRSIRPRRRLEARGATT